MKPNETTNLGTEPVVSFGIRGCLSTFLGFIIGAATGAGAGILLWYRINPPSGPGYDEGIGWSIALNLWIFLGSLFGGVIGALVGAIKGTKRRQEQPGVDN